MHRDPAQNGAAKDRGPGIHTLEHLVEHLQEVLAANTAIVCIGNDLNGDDGAGVEVARRLAGVGRWTVHDARTVPENYLMRIVRDRPDAVVLIDALDFGAEPGAIEIVDASQVTGQGPSTHGPAPLAFLDLLAMMHPCRCAVLGIQPSCGKLGEPLSESVRNAVALVVQAFRMLSDDETACSEQRQSPH